MRIESSIPIQQSPQRRCPQLVGDCRYGRCAFGRTWWWEGGRTREARDNDERKFEHALNKSRGYVEFPFIVVTSLVLPPSHHQVPPNTQPQQPSPTCSVAAIIGWEWGTRDTSASRVPSMFLFFFFYSFTNFHYRYTTFTRTITTIYSNSIGTSNSTCGNNDSRDWWYVTEA